MDVDKRSGQAIADKNELAGDWPINRRWAAINRPLGACRRSLEIRLIGPLLANSYEEE